MERCFLGSDWSSVLSSGLWLAAADTRSSQKASAPALSHPSPPPTSGLLLGFTFHFCNNIIVSDVRSDRMPLVIILSNWDYAWKLRLSEYARHEKRKCFVWSLSSAWAPSIMRSVSNWNQSSITNNKQVSCVNWFITVSLQNWLGQNNIYMALLNVQNNAGGIYYIICVIYQTILEYFGSPDGEKYE